MLHRVLIPGLAALLQVYGEEEYAGAGAVQGGGQEQEVSGQD